MKDTALVSIILPVFNRESFITKSIESVINQSYSNWELLIIDDYSTDQTLAIAENHAHRNPKIKVVKNTNRKGVSGARNTGHRLAQGKYIAFLDSDDYWYSNHLTDTISTLEKHYEQIDFITANAQRFVWKNDLVVSEFKLNLERFCKQIDINLYAFENQKMLYNHVKYLNLTGPVPTAVIKSEVIKKTFWNEELKAGEDALFFLTLINSGARFAHINKFHLRINLHSQHTSNAGENKDYQNRVQTYLEFIKAFDLLDQQLAKTKKIKLLIKERISEIYFWQIAYNIFLTSKSYRQANSYFTKGIASYPFRLDYFKTYFIFLLRWLINSIFKACKTS